MEVNAVMEWSSLLCLIMWMIIEQTLVSGNQFSNESLNEFHTGSPSNFLRFTKSLENNGSDNMAQVAPKTWYNDPESQKPEGDRIRLQVVSDDRTRAIHISFYKWGTIVKPHARGSDCPSLVISKERNSLKIDWSFFPDIIPKKEKGDWL